MPNGIIPLLQTNRKAGTSLDVTNNIGSKPRKFRNNIEPLQSMKLIAFSAADVSVKSRFQDPEH